LKQPAVEGVERIVSGEVAFTTPIEKGVVNFFQSGH
jgi:hypothetical protein